MIYQFNTKSVTSDSKLSDIIFDNPYFILMLEHFEIELVVHEKTINQICIEKEIDSDLFLTFANLYNGFSRPVEIAPSLNNVRAIISFLLKSHDYYINEKLPKIHHYIQQLYSLNDDSQILLVENFYNEYLAEVKEHLDYESHIVFPYILKLHRNIFQNEQTIVGDYSVAEYKVHHNDIEEKLTDLKNLLIKYLPLQNGKQIRRKILFSLFDLEFELKIHTEIEDHILIPLVTGLEGLRKNNP